MIGRGVITANLESFSLAVRTWERLLTVLVFRQRLPFGVHQLILGAHEYLTKALESTLRTWYYFEADHHLCGFNLEESAGNDCMKTFSRAEKDT
jgi:hypothetical protein